MPSTSKKQHNFMAAVANNPEFSKKAGVPQSVGEEFMQADKGMKVKGGPQSRPDLQKVNTRKTNHGKLSLFKEGGMMKKMEHSEKSEMKSDISQDKKMIKRAFFMHDKQEHKGEKTDLSKLKKGGITMKKMASGGMAKESMGPRTMAKDVEKGSNKLTKFGESAVQKRGKTKGINLGDSGKTEPIDIGTKAKMVGMKKGGSVFRSSADGIASKGKTRAMMPKMKGKVI